MPPDASQPSSDATLEVNDLCTEFHLRHATVRAVEGVSFRIAPGECVGVVGESGCGKSTLGLSIMRILPRAGHITHGSILLGGTELTSLGEREMRRVRGNRIGMIFQDPMTGLDPTMTIGRQIAFPVRIHRQVSWKKAMDRAVEVLTLVGMPHPEQRIHAYPHQLSGGLRQRVMIAMALACDPELLIADEPTTALDVVIQAQILDLIDDLRKRLRMAVVLVTHDMGVVATRTDRVMVMYAGKVVEAAPTDELFSTLRHPYTEALLQSIPRIDQDRTEDLFHIPGLPPDLSREIRGCSFAPRCHYASEQCTLEEPMLAPGTNSPSPSSGLPRTNSPSTVGAEAGKVHVFACFRPVGVAEPTAPVGMSGVAAALPPEAVTDPALAVQAAIDMAATAAPVSPGSATPAVATSPSPAAASDNENELVLEHVVKEYPAGSAFMSGGGVVHAVSDVSFTIKRGQTFGLVGESGCGKSTLGRLVVSLERPTSGTIVFEGRRLQKLHGSELRHVRRDAQLMFQDPYASLDPRMKVGAIVSEPLDIHKVGTTRQRRERVAELLAEVGLPPDAGRRYAHEFSGGQRQRVGLARALALNPHLIVADEPVSALDVSIQAQILNLMRSLQQRHQMTYLTISHNLAVVRYVADTLGVMYLGKLVEIGPVADVYDHPAHPYTRGLIDTIPDPDPDLERGRRAAIEGDIPSAVDPPSGCRFRTRCTRAQDLCAEQEPPLRPFGTDHLAACHFPLQTPLSSIADPTSPASAPASDPAPRDSAS